MAKKTETPKESKAEIKLNILEPRATEKTYLEQSKRTYVFEVKKSSSKQEIKALVEKDHHVTVEDVRVLLRKGKKTRFSKGKHAYPGITFRRDRKYAYITLKDGDSIKVFQTESDLQNSEKQGSTNNQSAEEKSQDSAKKLSAKAPKKGEKNA